MITPSPRALRRRRELQQAADDRRETVAARGYHGPLTRNEQARWYTR